MAPVMMYIGTYTSYKGLAGAKSEGICKCTTIPSYTYSSTHTSSSAATATTTTAARDRERESRLIASVHASSPAGSAADRCEFDAATGKLSKAVLAAPSKLSPSWLRWHPTLPVLYSTQETNEGSASALVSYRLTDSGDLVETARVSTCGGSACHFNIHPSLTAIACANHGNYQTDVGSLIV